ncbi:MAG: nuclear transport factor 2 family protein [Chloroflexota bacterium]
METSQDAAIRLLQERLQRFEDERDILQTLYRYAHTIDSRQAAEWADCFVEDGVFETRIRENGAPARHRGRAALTRFVELSQRPEALVQHGLMEPVIAIDGDSATATSYWVMFRERGVSEPYLRGFGIYRDRLVRCPDGQWRFLERVSISQASNSVSPDGKSSLPAPTAS